jgi:hypothetical protein
MQPFRVPTRSLLRSFWLVFSAGTALLAAAVLWWLAGPREAGWGLAMFAVLSTIGWWEPALAMRPYASWKRLARKARRAARLWLTAVVFLILTVVGRLGARLPLSGPTPPASGWVPKRKLPHGSYAGDSDIALASGPGVGWARRLAEWAWRSGNAWAWSLIPLLALLKGVEGESRGSLGGNVYTLY